MANQMTITFNVENQILRRTDPNKIIEKSKNYLFAEFSFSEDWDNTNKAIIFENNVLRYKIYLDSNNKCQVPNRIIRNDGFTISVVGEDNNDFVKITTSELYIAVGKGIKSEEEMESIYEITSQSLDVNKNGGTCNLEIKDEEKFYYEMQENDFSNMVSEGGNTWSLDLSETLENVITEFKKRIGVDWVALGLTPPVPSATKCVYSPTRKTFVMFGDEEITYYILSAVDGVGDTSTNFYYQNGSWHVTFFTGNLVDNETFNFRMAEKQDVLQAGEGITISGNEISTDRSKVVANPILVGDEPDLEGAEIDGVKYKVGGGGKLYEHIIQIRQSAFGKFSLGVKTNENTPFTMETFLSYLYALGYSSVTCAMPCCTSEVGTFKAVSTGVFCYSISPNKSLGVAKFQLLNGELYANAGSATTDSFTLTDTVTEV